MNTLRPKRSISRLWVLAVILVWAIAIGLLNFYHLESGPFPANASSENARSGYAMGSAIVDAAILLFLPTVFLCVLVIVVHAVHLTPLQTRIANVFVVLLAVASVAFMFAITSPFY